MSTLISVHSGDGSCIGRCDEKCYDAAHPDCDCICGGMNHGKGKNKAMQNTSDYGQAIVDEFNKKNSENRAAVNQKINQIELFK